MKLFDSKAFTYIELVIVIMTVSVLAVTTSFYFNRNEIASPIAADQLMADIRYIRLKAITVGQNYKIVFSGNSYTMSRSGPEADGETKYLPDGETAVANFGTQLRFNTLGEPCNESSAFPARYGQIQLSGGSTILIYNITGKTQLQQ